MEVKGEDGEDEEMSLIEMSVPPKRPYRKKTTEEKKRKERRLAVTSVLAENAKSHIVIGTGLIAKQRH